MLMMRASLESTQLCPSSAAGLRARFVGLRVLGVVRVNTIHGRAQVTVVLKPQEA